MFDISNPREAGRLAVQKSVAPDTWRKNVAFSERLRDIIASHPLMHHPIIGQLDTGSHDLAAQQFFHLEFRHAFAQIFTDGLIHAMATSSQLEPQLGATGKVAARFLLQLNVLDELGFVPNGGSGGDYAGHPALAHYVQFDETLRALGLSAGRVEAYCPSDASQACRATFESNYGDHVRLTAVLAVSESVFTQFCGPWAKNVGQRTQIDVSSGYHSIHVEKDGRFIDDDHSDDAWYVFNQAVTPARYDDVEAAVRAWLDTWRAFLDFLARSQLGTQAAVA